MVEEECVPIETEIVMPKPKTREWLCECGTKLKTGSAKNIKAHTSTQTHRNRMALIGQGLKPEDHMDKVYPNRFKTKEPVETKVEVAPATPKPVDPIVRQKQIQQAFQPVTRTTYSYDFEDRVQSEVNKRWEAKVKQDERERRLIKEAEERVRKEYEEKLKPPPAVRGQTFRPRKSNRTFDTTSTMLGRRRQYNF